MQKVDGRVEIKEFYDALSSIGTEKAKTTADAVIKETKLPMKDSYTTQEALRICEAMKERDGYIRMAGCLLLARIAFRKK